MLLFQQKLTQKMENLDLSHLPKTLLLEGPKGCGKHTLCKELSKKFDMQIEDITKEISLEKIQFIDSCVFPKFYLIDLDAVSEKVENVLLKFLEEPTEYCWILLLVKNSRRLLSTIRNRCQIWTFEKYREQDLRTFLKEQDFSADYFELINTPGLLIEWQRTDLNDLLELCEKIYTKAGVANFSNLLSVTTSISFHNEKEKLDFDLFIRAMQLTIYRLAKENPADLKYYQATILTSQFCSRLENPMINKETLFENFLCKLRRIMKQ